MRALVAQHWDKHGADRAQVLPFVGGAALVQEDQGARMWVLIDDGKVGRFGPALALADSRRAESLEVLVEEAVPGSAGAVARRAREMREPPGVWSSSGRTVRRAEPSPLMFPSSEMVDARLAGVLAARGADPVVEHGVLRGEVLGLEVARVVGGELMVGVGRHDREARVEMRPGQDLGEALDEAVASVRAWRRPGVASHPANTLARSRWLRSVVVARPELVGASSLAVAAPPLPWFDLTDVGAAPAVGSFADGSPVVVVCSAGVDLDVVPTAADCRLAYAPDAKLIIAVPEGDDVPVSRRLAAGLARPAEVLTVPKGWEAATAPP